MKIGLYDSGLGGLTILRAVAQRLPAYDYLYYGDTASLPLGDKRESEIYTYVETGVAYLFEHDCALVIIACNTASAETLRALQDNWLPSHYPDRKILGVIIPVVEAVVDSGVKRALLLGTRRTVSSGKYHFELGKLNTQRLKIEAEATPELVPLIESGQLTAAFYAACGHIEEHAGDIDAVILGCTHYTLLSAALRQRYGEAMRIFSQDEIVPEKLALYLQRHHDLQERLSCGATRTIHLTKHADRYDEAAVQFLEGRALFQT